MPDLRKVSLDLSHFVGRFRGRLRGNIRGNIPCVSERAVLNRDAYLTRRNALSNPRKNLPRQIGQHGIGEDVIDIPGSAFNFSASPRHFVQQDVVILKSDPMRLSQSFLNLAELQADNQLHRLVPDWEVRNDQEPAKKCRLEYLVQFRLESC